MDWNWFAVAIVRSKRSRWLDDMIFTISIGEPFKAALEKNHPSEVADSPCRCSEDFFARGLARLALGRIEEARADFKSASAASGQTEEAARLELAYLDVRNPGALAGVAATARETAQRVPRQSKLAARGVSYRRIGRVQGGQRGKCRRRPVGGGGHLSGDRLRAGRAEVLDTLGMVQAARGRVDDALHHYALSLAAKALGGDSEGIAISLGNMGRVQIQAGRFERALECLRADLALAEQLGDSRGIARVLNDIGRAYLGLGEDAAAGDALKRSLELARQKGYRDIEFFARKDLVLTDIAAGRVQDAERQLKAARDALPEEAEDYFRADLTFADGVVLAAKKHPEGVTLLRAAVDDFTRLGLPDYEIAARIELAKALLAANETREAEQALLRGVESARTLGLVRFLPLLNEIMTQLDIVEGAAEESHRALGHDAALGESAYVIRGHLGSGAFGDVFRVYDAQRRQEAALKVLRLADVYDPQQRQRLMDSARSRASGDGARPPSGHRARAGHRHAGRRARIRPAGIRRGPSLRSVISELGGKNVTSDVREVLSCLSEIAFALAVLHQAGVLHRDLKPDNIVLRDNRQPVLLDFGIAYLPGHSKPSDARIVGTLPYMSPEQLLGGRLDNRSDLYSLGVIAYEWLTGIRPLRAHGATLLEQVRDLATQAPPPLSQNRTAVPAPVEALVMELLEKSPRQRPATRPGHRSPREPAPGDHSLNGKPPSPGKALPGLFTAAGIS